MEDAGLDLQQFKHSKGIRREKYSSGGPRDANVPDAALLLLFEPKPPKPEAGC